MQGHWWPLTQPYTDLKTLISAIDRSTAKCVALLSKFTKKLHAGRLQPVGTDAIAHSLRELLEPIGGRQPANKGADASAIITKLQLIRSMIAQRSLSTTAHPRLRLKAFAVILYWLFANGRLQIFNMRRQLLEQHNRMD